MMRLQAEGRAAPVWIAATVVVTRWATQATQLQASSNQARYAAADEQRAMKARMEGDTSVAQGFPHGGIGSAFKALKGFG